MADLSAQITTARQAGYTDADIAAHLASDPSLAPKFSAAKSAGYSDSEILSHLDSAPAPSPSGKLHNPNPGDMSGMRPPPLTGYGKVAEQVHRDTGDYSNQVGASVLNGLSLGNADRVSGAVKYGQAAIQNFFGDHSVSPNDAYAAGRDTVRADQADFAKRYPVSNFAANMLGGAPVGEGVGGFIAKAATPAMAVVRSIGAGVGVGAAYGASGDKDNPIRGGLEGGAVGGLVGGAIPLLAQGARSLVNGIPGVGQGVQAAEGAMTKGEQLAARVMARRTQNSPTLATDIASAHPDALPLDVHPGLTDLAEVAAQSPGQAREQITTALSARDANAGDRIQGAIGEATSADGKFLARRQGIIQRGQQASAPFFREAYANPIPGDMYQANITPVLSRIPEAAVSKAQTIARNLGEDTDQLGFIKQPDGSIRLGDQPSLKTLSYVKQGMDSVINGMKNATGQLDKSDPLVRSTVALRKDLGNALNTSSKPYAAANKLFGGEAQAANALSLGRGILGGDGNVGKSAEAVSQAISDMSNTDRDMFRAGVGEALVAKVRSGLGGVNTVRQLLKSQELQDRVKLAFPSDQQYERFITNLDREVGFKNNSNQVLTGPATFRRAAARDDLNVDNIAGQAVQFGADAMKHGVKGAAIGALGGAILRRLPGTTQNILDNPDANATIGRVLSNRSAADAFFAKAGQASTKSINQAMGSTTARLTGQAQQGAAQVNSRVANPDAISVQYVLPNGQLSAPQ